MIVLAEERRDIVVELQTDSTHHDVSFSTGNRLREIGCCRYLIRFVGATDLTRALGGYGERVTDPADIIPAIQRGIRQTQDGTPALLEFITAKEITVSVFK
ncbi:MAG: hypothetical protein ACRDJH_20635 [Thermomicrobiales bacterium]